MTNKKTRFLIIMAAFVFCFALIILIYSKNQMIIDKEVESTTDSFTGNLDITPEEEISNDNYMGDADYDLEVSESYVGFTNLELVYDILTLDTISRISGEVATYLSNHGYADIHSLTILEQTIAYDKSYPYFVCFLEGVSDKYLEIRYDITTQMFEFQLVQEY